MSRRERRGRAQVGLSLVELLVAMTILAMAGTISLVLYDSARRSFKQGENVTEQQQIVRIAFDLLTSDIRIAGFNTNPDGDEDRPDEQFEAAYPTAVVIRADFDGGDPVESTVPETTLAGAGSAFDAVTTGNDEIVAYVLAKPDRASSASLSFSADVRPNVRDGNVETINIPDVDLDQLDPPYTLYRISLDASSGEVRVPLVENVRSMSFRYYDRSGDEITAVGGSELPASKRTRAEIRRVSVEIEGLTRDPDPTWVDTADSNPRTRGLRKFRLSGDVTPRNLGMSGIRDFLSGIFYPTKPGRPDLDAGHCGGLYVSWPPNPIEEEISHYVINYRGTSPPTATSQRVSGATQYYLDGLQDDTEYEIEVQAVNAASNRGEKSDSASATTVNLTTPRAPANPDATFDARGAIDLTWSPVRKNTAGLGWDPLSPLTRDLAGYRVYRGTDSGFIADPSSLIADESRIGATGAPTFADTEVVNCAEYFYRVRAVDRCGRVGDPSDWVSEVALYGDAPAKPLDVQAFLDVPGTVRLIWAPVKEDVQGETIHIEDYNLFWSGIVDEGPAPPAVESLTFLDFVAGATEYYHDLPLAPGQSFPPGKTAWYAVSAVDECPVESERSTPASPTCYFSGVVYFELPDAGERFSGSTEVRVAVRDGVASYSGLELRFSGIDGTTSYVLAEPPTEPGTYWSYDWAPSPPPPGIEDRYEILAQVQQTNGPSSVCAATATRRVVVVNDGS